MKHLGSLFFLTLKTLRQHHIYELSADPNRVARLSKQKPEKAKDELVVVVRESSNSEDTTAVAATTN